MEELLIADPEVGRAVCLEIERQTGKLEMIASENFVSVAVRQAQGSVLTHKYAEGYPGTRYYGGCEYVDVAEGLARERSGPLRLEALAQARQRLGQEQARLEELHRVNPAVPAEEVTSHRSRMAAVLKALDQAAPRLDSLRLVLMEVPAPKAR